MARSPRAGPANGIAGILIADPVYAEGGGDITVDAGRDVLSRRDSSLAAAIVSSSNVPSWIGGTDEPWRSGGTLGVNVAGNQNNSSLTTSAAIDPQLFAEGLGTLGGGNITVNAGRNVSDLSVIATDSLMTVTAGGTKTLATFGRGNVNINVGNDILGGRVDVASGSAAITAVGSIISAGTTTDPGNINNKIDNLLLLRLTDATVDIQVGGNLNLQGVAALGVSVNTGSGTNAADGDLDALGLYSAHAGLDLTANGTVVVANEQQSLLTVSALPRTASRTRSIPARSWRRL